MIRLDDIHSLSDFQRKTREHLERLRETGRPEVLTINGKAELVVQDAASYQKLLERLEVADSIAALAESMEKGQRGESVDALEAIAQLRRELNLPPAGS